DEQDAVFRINVGRRDGHARVEVADGELDAVADELVGDRHALFRIRNVVALLEDELLAQNAPGLVDVVDGLLRAVDELRAERRVRSRDRPGDADLDVGAGGAGKRQCGGKRDARQPVFCHVITLPKYSGARPSQSRPRADMKSTAGADAFSFSRK